MTYKEFCLKQRWKERRKEAGLPPTVEQCGCIKSQSYENEEWRMCTDGRRSREMEIHESQPAANKDT